MKKLISQNQLATCLYNISKAFTTFLNVAPMSKSMIQHDIEYMTNHYNTFYVIIEKHYGTVRIQDSNYFMGEHLEFEVNVWDGKYYVEF